MNRICATIVIGIVLGLSQIGILLAQPQVRGEDHFWRKRVVNRIPLGEKNQCSPRPAYV